MDVVTRSEAKAAGLKTYFTGKPCKQGHISSRRTANGNCIECDDQNIKRGRKVNPQGHRDANRRYFLKSKYGLTCEEADAIYANGCEICGTTTQQIHIDHDHETGVVRGGLCMSCNTAIGKLGDSVSGLMKAISYLQKASECG